MKRLRPIMLCCVLLPSLIGTYAQSRVMPSMVPTDDTDARVNSILSQMTLEEKVDLLGGVDGFFIRDVPRLKLPRFKMADGPIGVRNFGPATAMAAGIGLTATWNPELAERVGTEIGREVRQGKG